MYNRANKMTYNYATGTWNPADYDKLFNPYTDLPASRTFYKGAGNKTPFTETLRNSTLAAKTKLSGAQVPAVYDPDFANQQRMLYENLGDAAFDAGIDKLAGAGGAAGAANSAVKGGGLKGFYANKVKPNFGWDKWKGAKVFGKNIGKAANIGSGIMYGAQALGNLDALDKQNQSTEDLIADLIVSSGNNPILNSYLTSDQKSLLRKAKKGDLDPEMSLGDFIPNDAGDLLDIGKGVLMGLPGGIPGMIIGGVGSAVNSGLEGAAQEQAQQNAELEALLMALQDAEMQYQSMKRPNFTGLGIQQRYQNMYM